MTMEEKIQMYKNKQRFVEQLSGVFQTTTHGSTVEGISYEIYHKSFSDHTSETREYVIVSYIGGAKSPRTVSGYSCTAIFRIIGALLNGGYYDEVRDYEALIEDGYQWVAI